MPTLAMETKELLKNKSITDTEETRVDKFISILDKTIHEAKDMLMERFEYICSQSPDSAKLCMKTI